MAFNINTVVKDMISSVKSTVKTNWKEVKKPTTVFLNSRKERLEQLAELRIMDEIDEEFFLKRLADEKKIFESELHALAVISKSIAQAAANAAIDTLEKAVRTALPF